MIMTFRHWAAGLGLALAVLLGLASATAAAPAPAAGMAHVHVIHVSSDTPPVDIYDGDSKLVAQLGFKDVSDMLDLSAGTHILALLPGGQSEPIAQTPITVGSGKTYSVLVAGKRADLTFKILEDDLSPLATGKARVRAVHASPDTPAVDVAVGPQTLLFPNLGFLDASPYKVVDATAVNLELHPAGTQVVALSVPNLTLAAGKVYTVYAVGLSNGAPPLSLIPVVNTAAAAPSGPAPATIPQTGAGAGPGAMWVFLLAGALFLSAGLTLRQQNRRRL
jgi:hypothetical protein